LGPATTLEEARHRKETQAIFKSEKKRHGYVLDPGYCSGWNLAQRTWDKWQYWEKSTYKQTNY
jgi:hypothetical protein